MKTNRSCRRSEHGTQIAELAIVLPLLCFLVFTILEGSAFIRVHQVINNAAREGARISAQPENRPGATVDNPVPGIQRATAGYACNNGLALTGSGFSCTTSRFSCGSADIAVLQNQALGSVAGVNVVGSKVTVSCSYQLTYLPALPFFSISDQVALKGSAAFRNMWN